MKIALIGQAAFGEKVLDGLVSNGEKVSAVFCAPDKEGKKIDPLKTAAQAHGIKVLQFQRMRDRDAIEAFLTLKADLAVMAFVTDIVPNEILDGTTHGTIQYHPSLLPKHRGPSSINWPIIQGDTMTGLTIFWPDKGLDTGPVLLQKKIPIEPDDTLGSVYFDKLFPIGVNAMIEAVELIKSGRAQKLPQDHSLATYEGWCRSEQTVIDWSRPVTDIYNLIRGSDPNPGANTTLNGTRISFFMASKCEMKPLEIPGTVIRLTPDGFQIAVTDGSIFVKRIQQSGQSKIMASEWLQKGELKKGDRFGS